MGKRTSTPEQREARQAADQALREQAAELLTDPDAAAALAEQLAASTASPKVLGYSLRNQAMLAGQADERGMSLTDVDSFRGWKNRGRSVAKGEQGLRIVCPLGTETTHRENGSDQQGGQHEGREQAETDEDSGRVRFRMVAVFDISQTEGIEDAEEIGEADTVDDPAGVLRETLTAQLTRIGYEIEEHPAVTSADVDDGNLITVPAGRPVGELARALAVVLAAHKTGANPSDVQAA